MDGVQTEAGGSRCLVSITSELLAQLRSKRRPCLVQGTLRPFRTTWEARGAQEGLGLASTRWHVTRRASCQDWDWNSVLITVGQVLGQ